MKIIHKDLDNVWYRDENRIEYTGSWVDASQHELIFHDSASLMQASPFIEYVFYPWSREPLNSAHQIQVESDALFHYFKGIPPRIKLIRATICDHPRPETLISLFKDACITDVFLIDTCIDKLVSHEIRFHYIPKQSTMLDIINILHNQIDITYKHKSHYMNNISHINMPHSISNTGSGLYIFTSAAFNYFPKAMLLARSIREHLPDAHLCMALSDVKPEGFNIREYGYDSVIAVEDLKDEIPNLESWIFRHDVMELSTAIKPFVLNRILSHHDCSAVIFLDPDCYMFSNPRRLLNYFKKYSILITPHQTKPEQDECNIFREINPLRFGIFNLGFLGIKNDDEGRKFAEWWKKRLVKYCLIDLQSGLFTDQKWIDHVPVLFNKVKILRDSAYNVACWNFRDRFIYGDPYHGLMVDGLPVCFFHFAGTTGGFQKYMNWWGHDKDVLKNILEWYINLLNPLENNALFKRIPPYECYSNGSIVKFLHRIYYRENTNNELVFPRPYSDVGASSFYDHILKLNLPDYSRGDLLFGPQRKLLFHIEETIRNKKFSKN